MKKNLLVTLLLTAALAATVEAITPGSTDAQATSTTKGGTPSPVATLADANNRFALELYQQGNDAAGNFAISPYSVFSALAMTYAGARGQTEAEMTRVLHLPFDQAGNHAAAGALRTALLDAASAPACTLSVANRLWGQKGYHYLETFLETTRASYGAELEPMDFQHEPGAARLRINDWTLEQTHGKIPDLLPDGSITDLTRLVLTNAIYLKARWKLPFNPRSTKDGAFHLTKTETVQVPMMSNSGHFRYARRDGVQILALDYVASRQSMVILMPDDLDELHQIGSHLTIETLASLVAATEVRNVSLTLPRFRATASLGLEKVLGQMGMPTAFQQMGADLSGMDGTRDLFISAVVHKAVVDVAEEGTEAAAATAVVVAMRSGMEVIDRVAVTIDHPFLFLIRDEATGCILFVGRVVNPAL